MNATKRRPSLRLQTLRKEARTFANTISRNDEPSLFGITDGKNVGTFIEREFRSYLADRYTFDEGNAAEGIDFPGLNVDIKVTSARLPQSSCPFRSARQKIFGLGYSLLVFIYNKTDDAVRRTARLSIEHLLYVDSSATGDYTLTRAIRRMVDDGANEDDIVGLFNDRRLPFDDTEAYLNALEVLECPPSLGILTISNALQWRLQYSHAIREAGSVEGVQRL